MYSQLSCQGSYLLLFPRYGWELAVLGQAITSLSHFNYLSAYISIVCRQVLIGVWQAVYIGKYL